MMACHRTCYLVHRLHPGPPTAPAHPLTKDDICALITGLGDLRNVIHEAAVAVKTAIYVQLGLKITHLPGHDKIRVDVTESEGDYDRA
jgi:hypothetical protein